MNADQTQNVFEYFVLFFCTTNENGPVNIITPDNLTLMS